MKAVNVAQTWFCQTVLLAARVQFSGFILVDFLVGVLFILWFILGLFWVYFEFILGLFWFILGLFWQKYLFWAKKQTKTKKTQWWNKLKREKRAS